MKLTFACIVMAAVAVFFSRAEDKASMPIALTSTPEIKDNVEILTLFSDDQADRKPEVGQSIDWESVGPRDKIRLASIKDLYKNGLIKTGNDYRRAAMVLQHGSEPEDYLLAHELCILAIFNGVDARWLAAATEDRFLLSINRPQRFGTQSHSVFNSPLSMDEVDPLVSDLHRTEMKVPTLEASRMRLKKQNDDRKQQKSWSKSTTGQNEGAESK